MFLVRTLRREYLPELQGISSNGVVFPRLHAEKRLPLKVLYLRISPNMVLESSGPY